MRITSGPCVEVTAHLVVPVDADGFVDPFEFMTFALRCEGPEVTHLDLLELAHQAAALLAHPTLLHDGSVHFPSNEARISAVCDVMRCQAHVRERLHGRQYRS